MNSKSTGYKYLSSLEEEKVRHSENLVLRKNLLEEKGKKISFAVYLLNREWLKLYTIVERDESKIVCRSEVRDISFHSTGNIARDLGTEKWV